MIALFVQTLLLMTAAYFVGAAVACLVRRSFSASNRPEPSVAHPVEPLPEMVRPAAGSLRFGRSGEVEEARAPSQPAPPPAPLVVPPDRLAVPISEPAAAQDLKRIHLIDGELEARLSKLGIRRYEQIAAWMRPEVRRISEALGLSDRINKENWIEQAQVLSKGGVTHYAMRAGRGEVANAAPTPDEGEPPTLATATDATPPAIAPRVSTGGAAAVAAMVSVAPTPATLPRTEPNLLSPPQVAERAAFAKAAQEPAAPPAAAQPIRPAAPVPHDNLQRISGIDAEIEKLLFAHGVSRYSQIALWSPVDVARIDALLGANGRIARENWIEQAQILSRGGDTAFSRDYDRRARGEAGATAVRPAKLADAIRETAANAAAQTGSPPRADLGALRSVRSEAYQGAAHGSVATPRIGAAKGLRGASAEDLKRIRGIGVLIEKKLNQMGIVAYEQIANWTAQEIDRISQSLDFKGRIERENWVEQARILASGGTTEFSRRVDRGEVETSRYRP
jgi:predicted flap endonuclease-1-like 5' DNA nuclease